eukprot:3927968-Pleurochrysis_carterae.AAC.1
MGDLCKKYGVKKSARITQEFSNVKRLHRTQLLEGEQGALGIMWERHKGVLLEGAQEEQPNIQPNRVKGVIEKRKTADCWGGEEYLIEWDNGDKGWVSKRDVQNMDGTNARIIHQMRELLMERTATFTEHMKDYGVEADPRSWGGIWKEFLEYAQQGNREEAASENASIEEVALETNNREPYPTLYPGEVVEEAGYGGDTERRRRDMQALTNRARTNQHKRERKEETHKEKRLRLAKEETGTRIVSEKPEQKLGGGGVGGAPKGRRQRGKEAPGGTR